MSNDKAPIDQILEDAERDTKPPAGTQLDPAKVTQNVVDPEDADLDPIERPDDPRLGTQR